MGLLPALLRFSFSWWLPLACVLRPLCGFCWWLVWRFALRGLSALGVRSLCVSFVAMGCNFWFSVFLSFFLPSFLVCWLVCGALGLPPARVFLFLLLDGVGVCFFGAPGLLPALRCSSYSLSGCGLWPEWLWFVVGVCLLALWGFCSPGGVFRLFFVFCPICFVSLPVRGCGWFLSFDAGRCCWCSSFGALWLLPALGCLSFGGCVIWFRSFWSLWLVLVFWGSGASARAGVFVLFPEWLWFRCLSFGALGLLPMLRCLFGFLFGRFAPLLCLSSSWWLWLAIVLCCWSLLLVFLFWVFLLWRLGLVFLLIGVLGLGLPWALAFVFWRSGTFARPVVFVLLPRVAVVWSWCLSFGSLGFPPGLGCLSSL